MNPKETLSTECGNLYKEVLDLYANRYKDPETNPFCSSLAAIDLLLQIKDDIKEFLISVETDDDLSYQLWLTFVYYDLGRFYLLCDDANKGQTYWKECIELVKARDIESEAIIPYLGSMIDLGILYAKHGDYKKSQEILTNAENAYKNFKKRKLNVLTIFNVFGNVFKVEELEKDHGFEELERLYGKCRLHIGQIYDLLGESKKSADYLCVTLRQQLEIKPNNPPLLALNSANLSIYFLKQYMFKQARHYMAAATLFIREHEKSIPKDGPQNQTEESDIKSCLAYIGRRWSKYGLALLCASKERLCNDNKMELSESVKNLKLDDPEPCLFQNLQLDDYEKRITCDYCLTFEDAKKVYVFVNKWLDIAKDYYKPDKNTIEYADTMKDFATLYKCIAYFENDPINIFKMHKRQSKYYEELLEFLDPVLYMPIRRECWFEAASAHIAMLDIKLKCLKEKSTPTEQEFNKINQICRQPIKHYINLLESYSNNDGTWKTLSSHEKKILMLTHFNLGRLYSETIIPDQKLLLENLENSLRYYKTFTNECAKEKELAKFFHDEVLQCQEYISFLQMRIVAVRNVGKNMG